jgi:hypothetical protein
VSPVRYELDFYIPEDGILHIYRRENLKSCRKLLRISVRLLWGRGLKLFWFEIVLRWLKRLFFVASFVVPINLSLHTARYEEKQIYKFIYEYIYVTHGFVTGLLMLTPVYEVSSAG